MSPILTLQRRLREVGRLRIGEKVPTSNGKTRPKKIEAFRFTSKDRHVCQVAAELYGGEVSEFDDDTTDDRWQVTTQADSLPIVIPPGEAGFSQWNEVWSRGGCQRRCNGVREIISDQACLCANETPDPADYACKPTTRLSVMLQDLPGLGVWRLESKGYYAATELAGAVDICAAATARGQMLPARLRLEQRSVKRTVKGKVQTMRFVVPVLDVDVTISGLLQAMGAGETPVLGEGGAVAALEAGPKFTPVDMDAMPEAPAPSVAEQVASVNEPAERPKRKNAQAPLPGSGRSRIKDSSPSVDIDTGEQAGVEPESSSVSHDSGSGSPRSMTLDQKLAMKAEQANIDEETRHLLVSMLTRGRTESGKDVSDEEAAALFELYHTWGQGGLELRLHAERDEWHLWDGRQAVLPVNEDGRLRLTVPPRLQRSGDSPHEGDAGEGEGVRGSAPSPEPGAVTAEALLERAKAHEVHGNKVLGAANRIARTLEHPAIQSLDALADVDDAALLSRLDEWLSGEIDPEAPFGGGS